MELLTQTARPETSALNGRQRSAGIAPSRIVVLDVETVPDPDLTPDGYAGFPRPLWHKIVCISMVVARMEWSPEAGLAYVVESIRSGGEMDWSEHRLLKGFWQYIASDDFRMITFNGKRFDLPVILARSLIYGVDASVYFQRGDRWSNYASRYDEKWHVDLLQSMSAFGSAPAHSLDEAAVALGWAGKGGDSGAAVEHMVSQGELVRVRRYCEVDCANTHGLFLAWERLKGNLSEAGYDASLASFMRALEVDSIRAPHLADFARQRRRKESNEGLARQSLNS